MQFYLLSPFTESQIGGVGGNQQTVIELAVEPVAQGFFDDTEIAHHALVIQCAVEGGVGKPGFTHNAAAAVQVAEVHVGKAVDEQMHIDSG